MRKLRFLFLSLLFISLSPQNSKFQQYTSDVIGMPIAQAISANMNQDAHVVFTPLLAGLTSHGLDTVYDSVMSQDSWSPIVDMWHGDKYIFALNSQDELDVIDVSKGFLQSTGKIPVKKGVSDIKIYGQKALVIHRINYYSDTLSVIDLSGLTPVLTPLDEFKGQLQIKGDALFETLRNEVTRYQIASNGKITKLGKVKATQNIMASWANGSALLVATEIVKQSPEEIPYNQLEIFDFARNFSAPSSIITTTYPIQDIAISGTIAYIGTGFTVLKNGLDTPGRLEVWDMSNLAHPVRLNTISDNHYAFINLLIVKNQLIANNHHYEASNGSFGRWGNGFLSIFDISNPAYPAFTRFLVPYPSDIINSTYINIVEDGDRVLLTYWFYGGYSTIFISFQGLNQYPVIRYERFGTAIKVIPINDEIAYGLSLDGVISVIPIETPVSDKTPRKPFAFYNARKLPSCVKDARSAEAYLYALTCEGMLEVIDIKLPDKPAISTKLDPVLYANLPIFDTMDLSYPYLYLGSNETVYVFDVTNLNQISLVKTARFSRSIQSLQTDKTQVIAEIGYPYQSGSYAVELLDWTFSLTPTFLSSFYLDPSQNTQYFRWLGQSYLYRNDIVVLYSDYANKANNLFFIIDSKNPTLSGIVGSVALPAGLIATNLYILNNIAYVTLSNPETKTQVIQLIDISDEKQPRLLTRVNLLPSQGLFSIYRSVKWNQYLVHISDSALNFIDISQPLAPKFAWQVASNSGEIMSLSLSGDHLVIISKHGWRIVHPNFAKYGIRD